MSKPLDIADKMAARLTALTALAGVTCVVDRQKDIVAEVAKGVAKASACCVTILYQGFTNPDASQTGRPVTTHHYTVTVNARPVLAGASGMHADDALQLVSRCLHNWDATEATDGFSEIHINRSSLRPDAKYLVYDMDLDVITTL